jgi:transcriptional regulator with XRE-family HTH domain
MPRWVNGMAQDLRRLLGERIRELRKQAGLTQEDLADRADTNFRNIGGIERGERHIQLNTLARIAQALDVPPSVLLEALPKLPPKPKPPMPKTPKDEMLEELMKLLKRKSDDDVRLALELVKTLLRHKRGKGTR